MEQKTFERFSSIIYKESGIVLPPEKKALLTSRIQKRLRALGIKDEKQYLEIIELDVESDELMNLIDVVSTNVTHFYREEAHFKILREILTGWTLRGKRDFKIWCAAASSGEEPYTLAFEAMETLDLNKQHLKILATDICTKVLNTALRGAYSDEAVCTIPAPILSRYMNRIETKDGTYWKVHPSVAEKILFKKLNLISIPYPVKGPFDLIFCRNVMIYFDNPTRTRIVNAFEKLLCPDGYLFVSHSENLLGINHSLTKIHGSVFQKKI